MGADMTGDTLPDRPRLTDDERGRLERFVKANAPLDPSIIMARYLLAIDAFFSDGDEETGI